MSTNFALTACPCAKIFRVNGDISLKSAKLTYLSTFLTSNGNTSETCGAPLYQWPDTTNDAPTAKRGFRRPAAPRRHTLHARSPAFSDPAPTHMPTCTADRGFAHRPASRRRLHSPCAASRARGYTPPYSESMDHHDTHTRRHARYILVQRVDGYQRWNTAHARRQPPSYPRARHAGPIP